MLYGVEHLGLRQQVIIAEAAESTQQSNAKLQQQRLSVFRDTNTRQEPISTAPPMASVQSTVSVVSMCMPECTGMKECRSAAAEVLH